MSHALSAPWPEYTLIQDSSYWLQTVRIKTPSTPDRNHGDSEKLSHTTPFSGVPVLWGYFIVSAQGLCGDSERRKGVVYVNSAVFVSVAMLLWIVGELILFQDA